VFAMVPPDGIPKAELDALVAAQGLPPQATGACIKNQWCSIDKSGGGAPIVRRSVSALLHPAMMLPARCNAHTHTHTHTHAHTHTHTHTHTRLLRSVTAQEKSFAAWRKNPTLWTNQSWPRGQLAPQRSLRKSVLSARSVNWLQRCDFFCVCWRLFSLKTFLTYFAEVVWLC
jgi:hypothetical protein